MVMYIFAEVKCEVLNPSSTIQLQPCYCCYYKLSFWIKHLSWCLPCLPFARLHNPSPHLRNGTFFCSSPAARILHHLAALAVGGAYGAGAAYSATFPCAFLIPLSWAGHICRRCLTNVTRSFCGGCNMSRYRLNRQLKITNSR